MRFFLALAAVAMVGGVAHAQTRTPAAVDKGYVEGVAQSAFGNVTTQSYGAEVGVTVAPNVQVFGEFGRIKTVASTEFTAAASKIAIGLAPPVQPAAVGFTAKQPVTFFGAGAKYLIPTATPVKPYVLGGFGMAKVENDVVFTLGGTDAGSALAQYVTLGSDLSGTVTKPMLTLGGGVAIPVWQAIVLDLQYRYGRIFTEEQAITTNRAGIGFGVRF
jgi:opacity protein-like surface antigen